MSERVGMQATQQPQKERIVDAVVRLRRLGDSAEELIQTLMEGEPEEPKLPVGDLENKRPRAVFIKVWNSLPDDITDQVVRLEGIITDLGNRLLH